MIKGQNVKKMIKKYGIVIMIYTMTAPEYRK